MGSPEDDCHHRLLMGCHPQQTPRTLPPAPGAPGSGGRVVPTLEMLLSRYSSRRDPQLLFHGSDPAGRCGVRWGCRKGGWRGRGGGQRGDGNGAGWGWRWDRDADNEGEEMGRDRMGMGMGMGWDEMG